MPRPTLLNKELAGEIIATRVLDDNYYIQAQSHHMAHGLAPVQVFTFS